MRDDVRAFVSEELGCRSWDALQGDASTRRFWRLHLADDSSRILMEYPEPWTGENPDAAMTAIFQQAGLAVPTIYRLEPALGILVLEDLGDRMLEAELLAADRGAAPPTVLVEAATLAARVGSQGTSVLERSDRCDGPALDGERFRFEMDFFLEHFVGSYGSRPEAGLRAALHALADEAAATPRRVLCHRDFHSRNLMLAPDGRLTMVDIQDARWGPDTYDIASLVYDAYVDLPASWRSSLIAAFATAARCEDDDAFRDRLHCVAAQRLIKALGTFGYQIVERKNDRYEPALRRALASLRELLPLRGGTSELAMRFESLDLYTAGSDPGSQPKSVES